MDTLHPFAKQWLQATCAPESIKTLTVVKDGYLDVVYNEDKSIKVFVMSSPNVILGIGITYKDLISSRPYTFKAGIQKVAELLELKHIAIEPNTNYINITNVKTTN